MDWAKLLNDYGFPVTLLLLLASHAKEILGFAERSLSKVWPTFAEQQRLRLEHKAAANGRAVERQRLELEKVAAAEQRIDTILALKEMLVASREERREERTERLGLQNRLYKMVERHERLDAQIVEVLRDISLAIRSQTERLDHIGVKIGIYNAEHNKE